MTEQTRVPDDRDPAHPNAGIRRPVLLLLLGALLLVEAVVVLAVGVWSLVQLVVSPPDSLPTALALIVLVFAAGLWVLAIAINTFRLRPWIRGAALTWQVLQIVVAVACFQGVLGEVVDGWPLLIGALVGVGLVLSPSVTAVTQRDV